MKRLYGALAVVLLLLGFMLWHIQAVQQETELLVGTLRQAEQAAEQGDQQESLRLTQQAQAEWQRVESWFGVVLRMGDTDEVSDGFREVLDYLQEGEWSDYRSSNRSLMESVHYLSEVEQVRWANIF